MRSIAVRTLASIGQSHSRPSMSVSPVAMNPVPLPGYVWLDMARKPLHVPVSWLEFQEHSPNVFWLGRLYEVLRAGSPSTVRVFRNAVDAEEWLQRQSVG
jgi:hypothetical protein